MTSNEIDFGQLACAMGAISLKKLIEKDVLSTEDVADIVRSLAQQPPAADNAAALAFIKGAFPDVAL